MRYYYRTDYVEAALSIYPEGHVQGSLDNYKGPYKDWESCIKSLYQETEDYFIENTTVVEGYRVITAIPHNLRVILDALINATVKDKDRWVAILTRTTFVLHVLNEDED